MEMEHVKQAQEYLRSQLLPVFAERLASRGYPAADENQLLHAEKLAMHLKSLQAVRPDIFGYAVQHLEKQAQANGIQLPFASNGEAQVGALDDLFQKAAGEAIQDPDTLRSAAIIAQALAQGG